MANINQNPYYRANLSYNGFDMSEWLQFSCTVGQLLPISFDILSPGEKLKIKNRSFIRTETLTSSAFVRLRYRVEYFFVPFPQLLSYFGSALYNIYDYHSSVFESPDSQSLSMYYPCFTSDQMAKFMSDNLNEVDSQGISFFAGVKRLLDCFGYSYDNSLAMDSGYTDRIPFYYFQAYQRIFDAFYRNDQYSQTNPKSYKVDDIFDGHYSFAPSSSYDLNFERFKDVFQIRYRNYPKDFLTNVQRSPLFNNLSTDVFSPYNVFTNSQWSLAGSNGGVLHPSYYKQDGRSIATTNSVTNGQDVSDIRDAYSVGPNKAPATSASGQFLFSVANIRSLFATEKLLSITQRTKKTYEAQTLAHFGYDVPENIGNKVFFIGSHDGIIQIQDVNATATTSGEDSSRLGEIAGKGIGFNGNSNELSFTAPWHGIYMAIFSIVPDTIYPNSEISLRGSRITNFNDFYHPEFDKLGMVPRYAYEYHREYTTRPDVANVPLNTEVVGYSYNYYWLKNKLDRAWGNFQNVNAHWTAKRTMPTPPMLGQGFIPSSFFYYSPHSLDDVLLVPVQSDLSSHFAHFDEIYSYDSFMVDMDLKVKKVSTMSTFGLPSL